MKNKFIALLMLFGVALTPVAAQDFVNLTPRAKTMTQTSGELVLPNSFVVSAQNLPEEMTREVEKFITSYNAATGATATVGTEGALFTIDLPVSSLGEEGYKVNVTADGVSIEASTATGLYYAFQTIKKLLPANVMAGKADAAVTKYALPLVSINDAPRFGYRGFMLDVSRHFFTVDEVKRMLDVMSYYKMNRFHWHLSDDQGWRVEIKKYPKLTTVGSIAPNVMFTDMHTCTQYWLNKPYGPYFYTQDELRDVVAYAKERHIEIVPEIDMPGHFVAAMASYPEFSCYPNGTHTIWTTGGISSDILNVANPKAVQFAKDILSELMDIFPYETIHIGGDECPTSAWEGNAECQARYQELGLTNYRQLQSHFIKEMADFVQSKGRKLAVWNEAITAASADVQTVKSTGALVYCWTGPEAAAAKAAQLGLDNIYTPWGPYYINRKQGNGPLDPPGAGYGTDDVKATYNQAIPSATKYGVQGTFWTEHVSDREYMEWLALPRLIAIAEAGWTPQARRSFTDFQKRMTADTTLLNYGGYLYCKYHMLGEESGSGETTKVMPLSNTETNKYYYRLISGGTDATRKDRCIELVAEGSPLLTTYSANNIAVGRLWTNTQANEGDANYDYQWWSLEEDPAHPGKYAIVCKALPEGSVKPNPTATSTSGRWDYDNTTKHYNFQLGTGAYGEKDGNYYYSIASDQVSGQYWNSSMSGQGLSVNVYSQPNDGAGGQWQWAPMEDYGQGGTGGEAVALVPLEANAQYVFYNNVDGFDRTQLCDLNKGTNLNHSTDAFAANVWTVKESAINETAGTQTFKLQNAVTGRYISGSTSFVDRQGYPVTMGATGATMSLTWDNQAQEYRLKVTNRSLFPLPVGTVNAGATISKDATYDAPRLQGATWTAQRVRLVTLNCVDDQGATLGTFQRGVDMDLTELTAELCPAFKNTVVESIAETAENTYTVTYKRSAYEVKVVCRDQRGAILEEVAHNVPVGENYTFALPELPEYYTLESADQTEGTILTPTEDMQINATYQSEAYNGVKRLTQPVTEVKAGRSYVIYDASTADGGARQGYRNVNASNQVFCSKTIEDANPLHTWLLEPSGTAFKVKNEWVGLYVPALTTQATPAVLSKTAGSYKFVLNSDGETFKIQCTTNNVCWDGVASGALVGWNAPGHPYIVYEYVAEPYFSVLVTEQDEEGNILTAAERYMVKAGEAFTLSIGNHEGYTFSEIQGGESLTAVKANLNITVVYTKNTQDGISGVQAAQQRQTIYDLSGRRIQRPTKGLYIIGGTKVYVK